jgi:hypothetical protein
MRAAYCIQFIQQCRKGKGKQKKNRLRYMLSVSQEHEHCHHDTAQIHRESSSSISFDQNVICNTEAEGQLRIRNEIWL